VNGYTPVYAASINGHLDVIKILIASGADVNIVSVSCECVCRIIASVVLNVLCLVVCDMAI